MKLSFSNHEVIFSKTALLPQEEELWIEAEIEDWLAKIRVSFLTSEENKQAHLRLVGEEDHAHFKLYNWKGLGVCFSRPTPFGEANGKSVYLMMHGSITGHIRKVTVQISVEVK